MFEPASSGGYVAQSRGYAIELTHDGASLRSRGSTLGLHFVSGGGTLRPERPLPTVVNHLQGPRDTWRTAVRPYGAVRLVGIYPGIDAVFYGTDRHVEYDLVVAPGARADTIRLRFDGLDSLALSDGALWLRAGETELTQHAPVAYQDAGGRRVSVGARYVIEADRTVALSVGSYDPHLPLVIDPTITYSTYFGATGADTIRAMTTDGAGNVFVAGETAGGDLPGSTSATHGFSDGYVAKLSPAGAVLWVDLLGGAQPDGVLAIAAASNGDAYVTGFSWSPDFPTTAGAYRSPVADTCDTFVTRLGADGTLVASTMLAAPQPSGTGCGGRGIAVDRQGRPVVAGSTASPYFSPTRTDSYGPHLPGVNQPDGFFARFTGDLSSIEVSRLIAGSGFDYVNGAALDQYGNTYVVGRTTSSDFPVVNAYRGQKYEPGDPGGQFGYDGFLAMIWDNGTIGYSTYIGGSHEDSVNAVVIGHYDRPYIAGTTESAETWFYKPSPVGQKSGFMFEMVPNSTGILTGTTVGGSGSTSVNALAVGQDNAMWVAGTTDAVGYQQNAPDDPKPQAAPGGGLDMFVEKHGTEPNLLYYAYLLGGAGDDDAHAVALDRVGDIYVGGTSTGSYPVKSAVQPTKKDAGTPTDGVITKLACYLKPFLPVQQQSAAGGSDKVSYAAVEGCIAEPVSDTPWIHVTGLDAHYVYFTTDANPTSAERSGTITLSGKKTIPISQAAGSGGGGTTSTDEIVLGAGSVTNSFGEWSLVPDPIHGTIISQPDRGAPKITPAQQYPSNWFEMTFTADGGKPYHLWIHGIAENDSWQNDSVYAQFSDSVDASGKPVYRIATTDATWVSLEECSGCGEQGWGWQDNAYGTRGDLGPDIYFATSGTHTVRFQTREDGFSIGQVVLSAKAYLRTAPGGNINDPTIVNPGTPPPPPPPSSIDEIVLHAAASGAIVNGTWRTVADSSAASGAAVWNPDVGAPKLGAPSGTPANYFDITFNADAGKAYHLWLRLKADNDYWTNDSVWVQFSDSVDQSGNAVNRIGTTTGTWVSLEECGGCGEQGWGWQDNAYGAPGDLGDPVYFAASGAHTIRIQVREDGVAIDQIVLSAMQFRSSAPGTAKNDSTILPKRSQ